MCGEIVDGWVVVVSVLWGLTIPLYLHRVGVNLNHRRVLIPGILLRGYLFITDPADWQQHSYFVGAHGYKSLSSSHRHGLIIFEPHEYWYPTQANVWQKSVGRYA